MSFTADLTKFCKEEAPTYIDSTVRKAVIEIGNRLVYRSPVGDATAWNMPPPPGYVGGRFRANWQYGFGASPEGDLPDIDASGGAAINRIVSGALTNQAVGVHYIVNNLPYAQRLEDGWSGQAPNGMISLTELEFPEIMRRAAL